MKAFSSSSRFAALFTSLAVFAAMFVAAPVAWAAALPVSVDLTSLRAIQKYTLDEKADDNAYLLVSGIAAGKELDARLPAEKSFEANAKKVAVSEKQPLTLWKGELNDGQFALVTVSLLQGAGTDAAKAKEYSEKLAAAEKAVPERAKATLTADEFKALAKGTLKAEKGVIGKVKDVLSREKKTDHYGGLFSILIWNNGGKVVKRLDPVGLTFGEHFGTDVKIYTKIKLTRQNVLVQDEKGEWSEQQLQPLSDNADAVRVKMLETEMVAVNGEQTKHVTDYSAEVKVAADGKALKWKLGGENAGIDEIHSYWDYAE